MGSMADLEAKFTGGRKGMEEYGDGRFGAKV
jgi:hypothetical protein